MAYDLAHLIGVPDPEMLLRLPYRAYQEWSQYLIDGPLLYRILDTHLARITAILINANRDRKTQRPVKASDLQFWERIAVAAPSGEELFYKLLALNRSMGGDVTDKRSDDG